MSVEKSAKEIVRRSKDMMGKGWFHVSHEIHMAIAMNYVMIDMMAMRGVASPEAITDAGFKIADEVRRIITNEDHG